MSSHPMRGSQCASNEIEYHFMGVNLREIAAMVKIMVNKHVISALWIL